MQIIGWAKKFDQKRIDGAAQYLAKAMHVSPVKIESMAHQMGMSVPDGLRNCLCSGGQWYAGGMCNFIGPLGGAFAVPVNSDAAAGLAQVLPGDHKSFAQRVLEWPDRRDRLLAGGGS